MKKNTQKLVLHRETLIDLERSLDNVAGGIVTAACTISGLNTCGTCQGGCTSNLC